MYRSRRDSGNAWGRAKDVKLENLDQITRVQPNSCKTLAHSTHPVGASFLPIIVRGSLFFPSPFACPVR